MRLPRWHLQWRIRWAFPDHISETELENVSASSIVENNGTLEDLYKKLDLEDSVPF